jgi:PAS domain S-box-containing protein
VRVRARCAQRATAPTRSIAERSRIRLGPPLLALAVLTLAARPSAAQPAAPTASPAAAAPARDRQPDPAPDRLSFSHILPTDGLPSVQLRRIIRDRQGFMWFATNEGLLRFDSQAFRTFTHDPGNSRSLSGNTIWDVVEDAAGNLWVGSDGGLDLWRRQSEDVERFATGPLPSHKLSSPFVRRLLLEEGRGLWIATFGGGLCWFDLKTKRVETLRANPADPTALPDDYVLELFRDSRGTIWVGTQSAGISTFDPATRRFRAYRHDPADPTSLAGARVSAIGEDAAGDVWVGTTGGVSRFDRAAGTFENVRFVAGDPEALQGQKVDVIARDRDGSMWFGTDGGGLSRFDPATKRWTHFRHVRGDPTTIVSNTVPAFYQDPNGDYWVGHWPWGVSYANRLNAPIRMVRTIPGQPGTIPDDTIHALLEDPGGDLWVGTDLAGLCRFQPATRRWTSIQPPPVPGAPLVKAVLAVCRDRGGDLWAGTWRGGIMRLDPATGRITRYRAGPTPDSLSSDFILSLAEDREGRIWVGTFGGGINRFVPERNAFVRYRHDPKNPRTLGHDGVGTLTVTRDGTLWAGTQAGVARFEPATDDWERFACAPGHPGALAGNFVNEILEDARGDLWVATQGGGLSHVDLRTKRCTAYGTAQGLPSSIIRSILADDRGQLWVGTTEGLVAFDPETRRVRVYDETSGVHGRVFNRGARGRLRSGEVMLGGAGGFEIFDPRRLGPDETTPPVVLTGLEVLNHAVRPGPGSVLEQSITLTRRLEIPAQSDLISFTFAALDYRSPKRTRIAYRLDGFDPDWRESGPERRATYTNLDPGRYTLRVRAATGEGVWNPPGVVLALVIVPAWWQTLWFKIGLAVALGSALVAVSFAASRRRYRAQLLSARREAAQARERQRVDDAIREREERLQMALHGADLGTWDWDVASGRVVVDPGWAAMIGFTPEELPHSYQTWQERLHPDDGDRVRALLDAHLAGETPNYVAEYRLRHRDGHWVWVSAKGRVIERAPDGKPVRVTGTHLDVTHRREAEAQQKTLEGLLAQSQKMESVGRLAGGVAHDLNNMLTPILGHAELLALETEEDDPRQVSLVEIRRAAERSRDLVRQLLAFARKQTLEMKRLDLNTVVRDFEMMLRRTLHENIAIDYDLAPSLPAIRGDALQVQQILLNLSVNAQDAMPDGGRLLIATRARRVSTETASATHDVVGPGSYVVLTVADTGAGMDEATRARVFEPFFTTKDLGRGTGLGLATVHGIVQQHGGQIHVESAPGRGSTFTVFFAAQEGAVAAAALPVQRSPDQEAFETILLAEDQDQVRDLCVLVLQKAGYCVLAAASAGAAMELSASHAGPIDLLLTDVVLPDLNGRRLFERLARLRPLMRVIYMSGYTANVITKHGVLDEGLSYLQKPFDGEALKAKVRQVLDAGAAAGPSADR